MDQSKDISDTISSCRTVRPLVVYLDSQDYSRFADAEIGRGREEDLSVFHELIRMKEAGDIKIIYSPMNMSELLQYDNGGRELTLRKAGVVERLASPDAFFDIARIIGYQILGAACRHGRVGTEWSQSTPISGNNGWFAEPADFLEDLADICPAGEGKPRRQRRAGGSASFRARLPYAVRHNLAPAEQSAGHGR